MENVEENQKTPECQACQKYFSIAAVAERFQISEKTIRRMITDRRIRAKRIGGSIRIPHSEIGKMIQDY